MPRRHVWLVWHVAMVGNLRVASVSTYRSGSPVVGVTDTVRLQPGVATYDSKYS